MDQSKYDKFAQAALADTDIDAIGKALGMDREEARRYAGFLRDDGLATLNFQSGARLTLTAKGHREIKPAKEEKS